MRKTMRILVDTKRKAFHLTEQPYSGLVTTTKGVEGFDLWVPLYVNGEPDAQAIFKQVEDFMVLNRIAHNVTSINWVSMCGLTASYEVTYNELEGK